LPNIRVPLFAALGQTLRETVCASGDLPAHDLSTRDGYAILVSDSTKTFRVVDTIHAADWKPRSLQTGEAVRVATGATLPCPKLRVVMQEDVERDGDFITVLKEDRARNIRRCGEEIKKGKTILEAGLRLDAGKLALLAAAGCTRPLVSPRLNVTHFTTGDEIIPPDQTPGSGQIRDSNSILVRGLLQPFANGLEQTHLPENFEAAWARLDLSRIEALADDPCLRETLWPARVQRTTESTQLQPLPWVSSGDITSLASANALLRVPPDTTALDAGAEVEYLPAMGMLET
jgi:molybdopterin biosynthesis enzyme